MKQCNDKIQTINGLWLPLCGPGVSVARLSVLQVQDLSISHLSGAIFRSPEHTSNYHNYSCYQLVLSAGKGKVLRKI